MTQAQAWKLGASARPKGVDIDRANEQQARGLHYVRRVPEALCALDAHVRMGLDAQVRYASVAHMQRALENGRGKLRSPYADTDRIVKYPNGCFLRVAIEA